MRTISNLVSLGAVAVFAAPALAAYVHVNSLPTGLPASFSKSTSAYMYLEGEKSSYYAGGTDTFADSADVSHTMFITTSNPSTNWSSQPVYDGARYGSYGSATASLSNVSAYWENVPNVTAGSYNLYIRAYPNASSGSSETFNFYVGTDRTSADAASSSATLLVNDTSAAKWYLLGTVQLTDGQNTFRLRTDTNTSNVRFDTIMMVAVPEPIMAGPLSLFAGAMLVRRHRK